MKKVAIALAIVGTVSAAIQPNIPRWISADKHGYGYYLQAYWNGTYSYEGETRFSWDFDYNCARSYFQDYNTYQWSEGTYCNNVVTEYDSRYGCSTYNAGYYSLEREMNKTISEFTLSWGSGFKDPVWGYDNYHVLEHKSNYVYIYMRPSDRAIEFVVDSSRGDGVDHVMYYPSGLTVDNSTSGVWDYNLRYASCGNNYTSFSFGNRIFGSKMSKPAINKPANLNAKPKAEAFHKIGGVRSLFMAKNSQAKSMMNAPSKATFLINKENVAAEAPMNLFMNKAAQNKAQNLFKNVKAQNLAAVDNKFAQFKSFVSNLKPQALAADYIQQQVDMVMMIADTNRDGALSRSEIKTAATAQGDQVSDQELDMIFAMVDANYNNKIESSELYNFIKMMGGVQLYTKTE